MKKTLREFLLNFPFFEGFCRLLTRRHVRAFMYHRFVAGGDPSARHINQDMLQAQMSLVCQHHAVITPDNHLAALDGQDFGQCPVVVTIDDGYRDCYQFAASVFQANRIPAMLFVTTGFVSGNHWFWWDKLAWLIDNAESRPWDLTLLGKKATLDLTSDPLKSEAWNTLADRCRFIDGAEKETLLADIAAGLNTSLPATPPPAYAASSWDEIREMATQGMLFGAHTLTHPILTRVSLNDATREIHESQGQLAAALGQDVDWFCYPQGGPADYNPAVRQAVGQKYKGCYLAYQEMQEPVDRLAMPRYQAPNDLNQFRWTLCGAEYLGLKLRSLLGMSTGVGDSYWSGSQTTEDNHE